MISPKEQYMQIKHRDLKKALGGLMRPDMALDQPPNALYRSTVGVLLSLSSFSVLFTLLTSVLFDVKVYAQVSDSTPLVTEEQNTAHTSSLSPPPISQWISQAAFGQMEPWFVCLRLSGARSLYIAHVYAIQARYRSWTAEWRRHRPEGYPTDEGVGLVTDRELTGLYTQLMSHSDRQKISYTETLINPPCSVESIGAEHAHGEQEYLAELWLRQPSLKGGTPVWRYWSFINPHLRPEGQAREMIKLIKNLVTSVAIEGSDLDLLLSPKESGSLYLTVNHPSRVWLNGVYYGQWPSVSPIKLAEGLYELKVAPIDPRWESVVYSGLEVLAEKKTKFKVEIE
jgi:hypothetical protein